MCRKLIYLVCGVVVLIMAGGVPARADVNIPVVNYSFEEPNVVKTSGWDMEDGALYYGGGPAEVPGWECDGPAPDSGVESINSSPPATTTDGVWAGWAKAADPNVYNLTDFLIGQGDVFELNVDAKNNWAADNFLLTLYYDDNGTRTTVAINNVAITGNMQTFTLTFNADTIPACYDHEIGIELDNPGPNWGWAGFDYVRLTLTSPLYRAYIPYPEHKGFYGGASVDLTWLKGPDLPSADNYHVYISNNCSEVDSNHPNADQGTVTAPNYLYSNIVQGDTYYWRIDTISGVTTYRGSTWRFNTQPMIAYNPDPETDGRYVPVDPNLSWDAGTGAVEGHVVIFGDSFSEVNNAPVGTSGTEPPYRIYLSDVNDTNCTPAETGHSALDVNTVYYWRVDTVESASVPTIHKGNVWNFQTVPIKGLGSITHEVWDGIPGAAVADLTSDVNYPDNPTFTDYLTSFDTPRERADNYGTRMHGWLYVETTGDYTFWLNSDTSSELWLGTDMIVSASAAIPYHIWPDSPSSAPIHLEAGNLYYIMALQKEDVEGDHLTVAWSTSTDVSTAQIIPGVYLLPRHLYALLCATGPRPRDGVTDVERQPILTWLPGERVAKENGHELYFSSNYDDIKERTATMIVRSEPNYPLPNTLDLGETYYWAVDEVNTVDANLWPGAVWSFTVADYLIVDDFEGYNNNSPDRVFQTWVDGVGYSADQYLPANPGNSTGSAVGHDIWSPDSPYFQGNIIETLIVHVYGKSMPMDYNNVNDPYVSEAIRTWDTPQDWTAEGVAALTIWFRGYRQSVGGISYNAATQTYTMTGAGTDIYGESDEFHYAYKQLSGEGSITAKVESLTDVHEWSKAGVMIRETLDADSAQVLVSVTPRQNGVEFMYRLAGETTTAWTEAGDPVHNPPHWVRIRRVQNDFFAEHSVDGNIWVDIEGDNPSMAEIPMSANTYIGLHVLSHEELQTAEAVFSHVSTTGNVTPSPTVPFTQSQDIGIRSNDADRLYVIVEDDDGNSELVEHSEPNGTQGYTWRDWNIDLREFSDADVNLAAITKLTLGVGNKAAPASAGTGSMYFDDIRLHWPRCVPSQLQPVGDLNDDCVVDESDLEIMANEWLDTATEEVTLVADLDDDGDVDFGDYAKLASSWLEERIWPVL